MAVAHELNILKSNGDKVGVCDCGDWQSANYSLSLTVIRSHQLHLEQVGAIKTHEQEVSKLWKQTIAAPLST